MGYNYEGKTFFPKNTLKVGIIGYGRRIAEDVLGAIEQFNVS